MIKLENGRRNTVLVWSLCYRYCDLTMSRFLLSTSSLHARVFWSDDQSWGDFVDTENQVLFPTWQLDTIHSAIHNKGQN
jgi:hypothetical protein